MYITHNKGVVYIILLIQFTGQISKMLSWQRRNSLDREVNTSNVSDFSWLNITFLFLEVRLSRTSLGTIMLPKDRCCF